MFPASGGLNSLLTEVRLQDNKDQTVQILIEQSNRTKSSLLSYDVVVRITLPDPALINTVRIIMKDQDESQRRFELIDVEGCVDVEGEEFQSIKNEAFKNEQQPQITPLISYSRNESRLSVLGVSRVVQLRFRELKKAQASRSSSEDDVVVQESEEESKDEAESSQDLHAETQDDIKRSFMSSEIQSIHIFGISSISTPGSNASLSLLNIANSLGKQHRTPEALEVNVMLGYSLMASRKFNQAAEIFTSVREYWQQQIEPLAIKRTNNFSISRSPSEDEGLFSNAQVAPLASIAGNKQPSFLGIQESPIPQRNQTNNTVILLHAAKLELLAADCLKQPNSTLKLKIQRYQRATELFQGYLLPSASQQHASPDAYTQLLSISPYFCKFLLKVLEDHSEPVTMAALRALEFLIDSLGCTIGAQLPHILRQLVLTYPKANQEISETQEQEHTEESGINQSNNHNNINESIPKLISADEALKNNLKAQQITPQSSLFGQSSQNAPLRLEEFEDEVEENKEEVQNNALVQSSALNGIAQINTTNRANLSLLKKNEVVFTQSSASCQSAVCEMYQVIMEQYVNLLSSASSQLLRQIFNDVVAEQLFQFDLAVDIRASLCQIAASIVRISQGDLVITPSFIQSIQAALTDIRFPTLKPQFVSLWQKIEGKLLSNLELQQANRIIELLQQELSQLVEESHGDLQNLKKKEEFKFWIQLTNVLIKREKRTAENLPSGFAVYARNIELAQENLHLNELVPIFLELLKRASVNIDHLDIFRVVWNIVVELLSSTGTQQQRLKGEQIQDISAVASELINQTAVQIKQLNPPAAQLQGLMFVLESFESQNQLFQEQLIELLVLLCDKLPENLEDTIFKLLQTVITCVKIPFSQDILVTILAALFHRYTVKSKAQKTTLSHLAAKIMNSEHANSQFMDVIKICVLHNKEPECNQETDYSHQKIKNQMQQQQQGGGIKKKNIVPQGINRNLVEEETKRDFFMDKLQFVLECLELIKAEQFAVVFKANKEGLIQEAITQLTNSFDFEIRLKGYYIVRQLFEKFSLLKESQIDEIDRILKPNIIAQEKQDENVNEIFSISRAEMTQLTISFLRHSLEGLKDPKQQFNSLVLMDKLFQTLFKGPELNSELIFWKDKPNQQQPNDFAGSTLELEEVYSYPGLLAYSSENYLNMRLRSILKLWPLLSNLVNSPWSNIRSLVHGIICNWVKTDVLHYEAAIQKRFLSALTKLIIGLLSSKESECRTGGLNILGSLCGLSYDFDCWTGEIQDILGFFRRHESIVPLSIWEIIYEIQADWDVTNQAGSIILMQICAPGDSLFMLYRQKREELQLRGVCTKEEQDELLWLKDSSDKEIRDMISMFRGDQKLPQMLWIQKNTYNTEQRIEGTITTDVVAYTMNEEEDAGVYGFMDEQGDSMPRFPSQLMQNKEQQIGSINTNNKATAVGSLGQQQFQQYQLQSLKKQQNELDDVEDEDKLGIIQIEDGDDDEFIDFYEKTCQEYQNSKGIGRKITEQKAGQIVDSSGKQSGQSDGKKLAGTEPKTIVGKLNNNSEIQSKNAQEIRTATTATKSQLSSLYQPITGSGSSSNSNQQATQSNHTITQSQQYNKKKQIQLGQHNDVDHREKIHISEKRYSSPAIITPSSRYNGLGSEDTTTDVFNQRIVFKKSNEQKHSGQIELEEEKEDENKANLTILGSKQQDHVEVIPKQHQEEESQINKNISSSPGVTNVQYGTHNEVTLSLSDASSVFQQGDKTITREDDLQSGFQISDFKNNNNNLQITQHNSNAEQNAAYGKEKNQKMTNKSKLLLFNESGCRSKQDQQINQLPINQQNRKNLPANISKDIYNLNQDDYDTFSFGQQSGVGNLDEHKQLELHEHNEDTNIPRRTNNNKNTSIIYSNPYGGIFKENNNILNGSIGNQDAAKTPQGLSIGKNNNNNNKRSTSASKKRQKSPKEQKVSENKLLNHLLKEDAKIKKQQYPLKNKEIGSQQQQFVDNLSLGQDIATSVQNKAITTIDFLRKIMPSSTPNSSHSPYRQTVSAAARSSQTKSQSRSKNRSKSSNSRKAPPLHLNHPTSVSNQQQYHRGRETAMTPQGIFKLARTPSRSPPGSAGKYNSSAKSRRLRLENSESGSRSRSNEKNKTFNNSQNFNNTLSSLLGFGNSSCSSSLNGTRSIPQKNPADNQNVVVPQGHVQKHLNLVTFDKLSKTDFLGKLLLESTKSNLSSSFSMYKSSAPRSCKNTKTTASTSTPHARKTSKESKTTKDLQSSQEDYKNVNRKRDFKSCNNNRLENHIKNKHFLSQQEAFGMIQSHQNESQSQKYPEVRTIEARQQQQHQHQQISHPHPYAEFSFAQSRGSFDLPRSEGQQSHDQNSFADEGPYVNNFVRSEQQQPQSVEAAITRNGFLKVDVGRDILQSFTFPYQASKQQQKHNLDMNVNKNSDQTRFKVRRGSEGGQEHIEFNKSDEEQLEQDSAAKQKRGLKRESEQTDLLDIFLQVNNKEADHMNQQEMYLQQQQQHGLQLQVQQEQQSHKRSTSASSKTTQKQSSAIHRILDSQHQLFEHPHHQQQQQQQQYSQQTRKVSPLSKENDNTGNNSISSAVAKNQKIQQQQHHLTQHVISSQPSKQIKYTVPFSQQQQTLMHKIQYQQNTSHSSNTPSSLNNSFSSSNKPPLVKKPKEKEHFSQTSINKPVSNSKHINPAANTHQSTSGGKKKGLITSTTAGSSQDQQSRSYDEHQQQYYSHM